MRTKWWAGALLVSMPWLLAACSDDDKVDSSQSASEAEAALCQQLTTLKAPIALAPLVTLTGPGGVASRVLRWVRRPLC